MDLEETVQVCELPKRPKGIYSSNKFRTVEITTNFYPVTSKKIEEIHIFRLKFTPQIPFDDRTTRNRVLENAIKDIREFIRNFDFYLGDPVISGMNIYSVSPPVDKERTIFSGSH